ncbi:MAG: hypothetical protein ACYCW6_28240 [Candidatus Xenobia bacterium]
MSRRIAWLSLLLVAFALPALAKLPAPPPQQVKVRILSPNSLSRVYAGKAVSVEMGMDDPDQMVKKMQVTLIDKAGAAASATTSTIDSTVTLSLPLAGSVKPGAYILVAQAFGEDGTQVGEHHIPLTVSAPTVNIGWVEPTSLVRLYPGRSMDLDVLLDDPAHLVRSVVFSCPADKAMKVTVPFKEIGQRWAAQLPIPVQVPAGLYKVQATAYGNGGTTLASSEQNLEVLKAGVMIGFIEPGDKVAHATTGSTLKVVPGLEDPASLVHTLTLTLLHDDKDVLTVQQDVKRGRMQHLDVKIPRDAVPGHYVLRLTALTRDNHPLAESKLDVEVQRRKL